MTHVWAVFFWKEYGVNWISAARVKSASASEIELENLSPLRRRD